MQRFGGWPYSFLEVTVVVIATFLGGGGVMMSGPDQGTNQPGSCSGRQPKGAKMSLE
jgi:hypothetical protein